MRVSISNSRIKKARTSEYNITSMASSIQPRLPAMRVWRSAGVVSRGQPKMRGFGDARWSGMEFAALSVGRSGEKVLWLRRNGLRRFELAG